MKENMVKRHLESNCEKVTERVEFLRGITHDFDIEKARFESEVCRMKDEVCNRALEIIESVCTSRDELLKHLNKLKDDNLEKVEIIRNDVNAAVTSLETFCQYTRLLVHVGSGADVMCHAGTQIKRGGDLLARECKSIHLDLGQLKLVEIDPRVASQAQSKEYAIGKVQVMYNGKNL